MESSDSRIKHALGKKVSLRLLASRVISLNAVARSKNNTETNEMSSESNQNVPVGEIKEPTPPSPPPIQLPTRVRQISRKDSLLSSFEENNTTHSSSLPVESSTLQQLRAYYYAGPFQSNLPLEKQLTMTVIDSFNRDKNCTYVIQLQYSGFSWLRWVRSVALFNLHLTTKRFHKYLRYRNKISSPSLTSKQKMIQEFIGSNFHFPTSLLKSVNGHHRFSREHRVLDLQKYLNSFVKSPLVLNHTKFLEFYHISNYSFNLRYGESLRETRVEITYQGVGNVSDAEKKKPVSCDL